LPTGFESTIIGIKPEVEDRGNFRESKKEDYRNSILDSISAEELIKRWEQIMKETIALRINC
jgi:hypothetical protein